MPCAHGSLPGITTRSRRSQSDEMALKVYYKEDILNAVHAAYVASSGPAALATEILQDQELQGIPLDRLLQVYMRGFNTALCAVGAAFGLTNLVDQDRGYGHRLAEKRDPATHLEQGEQAAMLELDLFDLLRVAIQREMQR
jgi:hypothetical protein